LLDVEYFKVLNSSLLKLFKAQTFSHFLSLSKKT
jgi:hypothetical protein